MSKAKSPKLRTFITLHALFKHTDENHRLNSARLNEFLRPYGLECNKKVIMDTAEKLNEAGIPVSLSGGGAYIGLAMVNRPLPDHELKLLIYAIETNPNLSTNKATELLEALKPAVTVYQESMLQTIVEHSSCITSLDTVDADTSRHLRIYNTVHEAICKRKRISIRRKSYKMDKKTNSLMPYLLKAVTYTPRYIVQLNSDFCVVGYNHARQRIDAVLFRDIDTVRLNRYNNLPDTKEIEALLRDIVPDNYIQRFAEPLYNGPVTLYCSAKSLQAIYDYFGQPNEPVERDERCFLTYTIAHAQISWETLMWLNNLPGKGAKIIGPEPLLSLVAAHWNNVPAALLEE